MRAVLILLASVFITAPSCSTRVLGTIDDVVLTASISDADLADGETAVLRFALLNGSSETVELTFPSSCQILPYIERRTGGIVHPEGGGWVCAAVITHLRLAPGEEKVLELPIKGGPAHAYNGVLLTLPAGQYVAYAELNMRPDIRSASNRVSFRVR